MDAPFVTLTIERFDGKTTDLAFDRATFERIADALQIGNEPCSDDDGADEAAVNANAFAAELHEFIEHPISAARPASEPTEANMHVDPSARPLLHLRSSSGRAAATFSSGSTVATFDLAQLSEPFTLDKARNETGWKGTRLALARQLAALGYAAETANGVCMFVYRPAPAGQPEPELDAARRFQHFEAGHWPRCEACGGEVRVGMVVHCYDDAGEVHVDCAHPYRLTDDPQARAMLGEPMMPIRLFTEGAAQ